MTIRNHLVRDLENLNHDILKMAVLAEENIRDAVTAFQNRDLRLAQSTLERDAAIDAIENDIGDRCAILLARQHPVSRDLRRLIATFKITGDLERIGDLAVHLARNTLDYQYPIPAQHQEEMLPMLGHFLRMLRPSVEAFLNYDEALARETAALDRRLDEYRNTIHGRVIDQMEQKPALIKSLTKVLFLARLIERMGDHVVCICEWTVYVTSGKRESLP